METPAFCVKHFELTIFVAKVGKLHMADWHAGIMRSSAKSNARFLLVRHDDFQLLCVLASVHSNLCGSKSCVVPPINLLSRVSTLKHIGEN